MIILLLFFFSTSAESQERDYYYLIPLHQPELTLDISDSPFYKSGTDYEWSLYDWPGKKYGSEPPKSFDSVPSSSSSLSGEAYFTLKTGNLDEGFYRLTIDYENKANNLCEVYIQIVGDQTGELLSPSDRALMNRIHWPLKKFFGWLNGRICLLHAFAIYYHCFQDWTVSDSLYLSIFYQRMWSESFHLNVSHYSGTNMMRRRMALFTRLPGAKVCDPFQNYCPAEKKTFDERLIEYFEWNNNNPYLRVVKVTLTVVSWLGHPFIFVGNCISRFMHYTEIN